MGAKQSSGQQSPRSRTFSSSSSGASPPQSAGIDGAEVGGGQGFNLLRAGLLSSANAVDRQRARSLSFMPNASHSSSTSTASHTHPAAASAGNNSFIQHRSTTTLGDGIRVSGYDSVGAAGHNGNGGVSMMNFPNLEEVAMAGNNFVEGVALAASAASSNSHNSIVMGMKCIKCPICNKFVLPDDIECHLVMCLTKPRLSYNEDVLVDAKGECVICLEELNPGDVIARLPCLCIYHKSCIDRWFEVNRTCPEHPGD